MSTLSEVEPAVPWRESAARLALVLESTADQELCLAVLKQLNRRFGDHGYPGFLKILLIISESTNAGAKRRLADTFAVGLRRGDVPSGVLAAWGATDVSSSAPRRQLDPIEYLTAWFSQRTYRPCLADATYRECLIRLVELFNTSAHARQWYPLKIEADLAGVEGAFTHQTRERLGILVNAWKQGRPAGAIADAVSAGSVATRFWGYRA
jgi:hypothetical protein